MPGHERDGENKKDEHRQAAARIERGKGGQHAEDARYVIALAGNPNTGKSTVFNDLTGLRQHVGKPSEPVVKPGDQVQKGQLIARIPDKALGAALHASIAGTVAEVNEHAIVLTDD